MTVSTPLSVSSPPKPSAGAVANTDIPPHRAEISATLTIRTPTRRVVRRFNSDTEARRCGRLHSGVTLGALVAVLLIVDGLAVMSVDERRPGPFQQFTGLPPTFHICIMAVLHLMTFVGGVSKTVNGTRLAMAIAWMFFLLCVGVLLLTPSFVGAYVASGMQAADDVFPTPRSANQPADRFYNGFVAAIGAQFCMFLIWLVSVFQMTIVVDLLNEAHVIEDGKEGGSELGEHIDEQQEKLV